MEKKLKEKENLILEYEDKILEMEQQIDSTNVCLSEKVKLVECLEDKIEMQNKLIDELEEDIINMKEKQRLQRNVMHAEKETQISDELNCSKEKQSKVEVREESCQTCFFSFTNSEVQTESIEIKEEYNFYVEEKSLQTSFLNESRQAQLEELVELKEKFADLETSSKSKTAVYFIFIQQICINSN